MTPETVSVSLLQQAKKTRGTLKEMAGLVGTTVNVVRGNKDIEKGKKGGGGISG